MDRHLTRVLGLSDAGITGLLALVGTVFTILGTVVVAVLTRDTRHQNRQATKAVDEFEEAWKGRGELLDGAKKDNEWLVGRVHRLELRDKDCQERLAALEAREAGR